MIVYVVRGSAVVSYGISEGIVGIFTTKEAAEKCMFKNIEANKNRIARDFSWIGGNKNNNEERFLDFSIEEIELDKPHLIEIDDHGCAAPSTVVWWFTLLI